MTYSLGLHSLLAITGSLPNTHHQKPTCSGLSPGGIHAYSSRAHPLSLSDAEPQCLWKSLTNLFIDSSDISWASKGHLHLWHTFLQERKVQKVSEKRSWFANHAAVGKKPYCVMLCVNLKVGCHGYKHVPAYLRILVKEMKQRWCVLPLVTTQAQRFVQVDSDYKLIFYHYIQQNRVSYFHYWSTVIYLLKWSLAAPGQHRLISPGIKLILSPSHDLWIAFLL